MNAIWCLFSVDNNYDQPAHNLVTWWSSLPDVAELQLALGKYMGVCEPDKTKLKQAAADLRIRTTQKPGSDDAKVRLGAYGDHNNATDFRLERLGEGQFPCALN